MGSIFWSGNALCHWENHSTSCCCVDGGVAESLIRQQKCITVYLAAHNILSSSSTCLEKVMRNPSSNPFNGDRSGYHLVRPGFLYVLVCFASAIPRQALSLHQLLLLQISKHISILLQRDELPLTDLSPRHIMYKSSDVIQHLIKD